MGVTVVFGVLHIFNLCFRDPKTELRITFGGEVLSQPVLHYFSHPFHSFQLYLAKPLPWKSTTNRRDIPQAASETVWSLRPGHDGKPLSEPQILVLRCETNPDTEMKSNRSLCESLNWTDVCYRVDGIVVVSPLEEFDWQVYYFVSLFFWIKAVVHGVLVEGFRRGKLSFLFNKTNK